MNSDVVQPDRQSTKFPSKNVKNCLARCRHLKWKIQWNSWNNVLRRVELCCLQEIRWRGASACIIEGKDSRYKIFWVGNENGTGGAGILLSEKWIEKVFDIDRVSDRIMMFKLAIDNMIITVLSCYAPQVGLQNKVKSTFYDQLLGNVGKLGADETSVIWGDLNGHIGKLANDYEGVHGGYGFGLINKEDEHILKSAVAHNLVVGNSYFTRKDNHLITYQSWGIGGQVDCILVRKSDLRLVRDISYSWWRNSWLNIECLLATWNGNSQNKTRKHLHLSGVHERWKIKM